MVATLVSSLNKTFNVLIHNRSR